MPIHNNEKEKYTFYVGYDSSDNEDDVNLSDFATDE